MALESRLATCFVRPLFRVPAPWLPIRFGPRRPAGNQIVISLVPDVERLSALGIVRNSAEVVQLPPNLFGPTAALIRKEQILPVQAPWPPPMESSLFEGLRTALPLIESVTASPHLVLG